MLLALLCDLLLAFLPFLAFWRFILDSAVPLPRLVLAVVVPDWFGLSAVAVEPLPTMPSDPFIIGEPDVLAEPIVEPVVPEVVPVVCACAPSARHDSAPATNRYDILCFIFFPFVNDAPATPGHRDRVTSAPIDDRG
ncbi:MAG: hypothetical protein M3Z31_01665 [Pseudomonadota bacterium]|nr:hypothetical protein [Pseudomonadota bacterium]